MRARFFVEGNEVLGRVILPSHLNGYKNVAHGGVVSALLDETMGWAPTVFGKTLAMYVTGELTVRFLSPVPVGVEIEVRSRLVEDAGRLAYCEGEIRCGGKVCARASGKFVPMSPEGTAAVIPYLRFDGCRRFRTIFDAIRGGE
ncbi:MAG: PaaI family thioesterase [Candidatus Deferrimicrobiaceae bacterium]